MQTQRASGNGGWFSSEMERLMSNAESALNGRPRGSDVGVLNTVRRGAGGYDGGYSPAMPPYNQMSTAVAAPYLGGAACDDGNMPSYRELARQLQVCMHEIRELRQELAVERDARSTVLTSFAKRIKEEMTGDIRSSEHHIQRTLRELEADLLQRITEQDNARALMKRSMEDALRHIKVQDRAQFDIGEQFREQLDELRGRVEQSVTLNQQMRSDMAQRFEKEAASHAHRLDVELMRYADMNRQQQQSLVETRRSVAEEVGQVSKTVQALVEDCWNRRVDVLTKSLQESIASFRATQERNSQVVNDTNVKLSQFSKDVRSELMLATGDIRDRVVALEGGSQLLTTRVDRFERKADSVFETANRLTAQMEAMQESTDKIAVHTTKSLERSQKIEESFGERDERILRCESQLSALAGLDRLKVEVEALRRGVQRVEGVMEGVKQTADRDERLVEAMQRNIDASLERADAVEKKAHKVVARVETAEQRLMGFVDRIIALEDFSEKSSGTAQQQVSLVDAVQQRLAAVEHRQRSAQEKLDTTVKETMERLHSVDTRVEATADAVARVDTVTTRKDLERIEKKMSKFEANTSNVMDNVRETRDAVDQMQREYTAISKKVDQWREMLDRKASLLDTKMAEFDAAGASVSERFSRNDKRMSTAIDTLEKRLEERIESVAKRADEIQTAATRRATQEAVGNSSRLGATVVDETLAVEVGAARRRLDALELRLRQLETKSLVGEEDVVHRHELQAIRSLISTSEMSWRNTILSVQQSIASMQSTAAQPSLYSPPPALTPTPTAVQSVLASAPIDALRRDVVSAVPATTRPQPVQQPTQLQAPISSRTDDLEVIHDFDSGDDSPVAKQRSSLSPKSDGTHLDSEGGAIAVAATRSSVSSLHGAAPDEIMSVSGESTMAAIPRSSNGLPPLASGSAVREATNPAAQLAAVPAPKKRSPYSDTSESEIDRPVQVAQPAVKTPAAATVVELKPPAAAAAVAMPEEGKRSIADDFDDDEEFEIADDTLRGGSAHSGVFGSPVASAAAATVPVAAQQPVAKPSSVLDVAATTDDDLQVPGRRSQGRRGFVSAGDTSSAAENAVDASRQSLEQPKKFHATTKRGSTSSKTGAAAGSSASDEEANEDSRSASPKDAASAPRSQRSSRRSAQSRRTTDVSLSLNSSKKQSSRHRLEETIEDIDDDDKLAEMLGFIDAKRGKR